MGMKSREIETLPMILQREIVNKPKPYEVVDMSYTKESALMSSPVSPDAMQIRVA